MQTLEVFQLFRVVINLSFENWKLNFEMYDLLAAFLQIFVMKSGAGTIRHIFRFVRYLLTFFHIYLPINIHIQLIIITNVSFVTNPAYFVGHLASPVVSF
jgi:hypothetical protein